MDARIKLKNKKKIVIKVGTSSLTNEDGSISNEKIKNLVRVISSLNNTERQVVLVTSGAIAVGCSRMGLTQKPRDLARKQALAAIGQAELIRLYEKYFDEYSQIVAQVLLTKDGVVNPIRRANARNTINTLLEMNIVPIINENDTVSTDEIEFGDNDTLSAHVASLIQSDLLVLFSDIDGLYDAHPKKNPNAKIISEVTSITSEIEKLASGAGSSFSTGGMVTKISAAKLCALNQVDMVIANGATPDIIFKILDGEQVGTLFIASQKTEYQEMS
jgi:glutamate 5-kinase